MPIEFQSPKDVLHVNDSIVDQLADGHGESSQGHRVDRKTKRTEHESGNHNRKRNRGQRDEGRAEVQQKQEQNDDDENTAVAKGLHHIGHGQIDEDPLLIHLGIDPDVAGQAAPQVLQGLGNLKRHLASVGVGLLVDGQNNGTPSGKLPVLSSRERGAVASFHFGAFDHAGHLADQHGASVPDLDHHPLEFFHAADPPQRTYEQFVGTLLVEVASRGVIVALAQGRLHLVERHAVTKQLVGIHQNLKLLPVPSHHKHLGDAGNRE